ncbi:MAG: AAC(3) family N-acetyltransferase [Bacillota bacterium]
MPLTLESIREAVSNAGLSGKAVCLHSSLRSFGPVDGGPDTVIDGFLAEGCTLLVPAFAYGFGVSPPEDPAMRPARNGTTYYDFPPAPPGPPSVYTPESPFISRSMGAIPAALIGREGRVRGGHPLNSFAALGPLAAELVAGQRPLHVYAPLEALTRLGGSVVLAGVGLTRMTLLHLAEQRAGRTPFRRWYAGPQGETLMAEVGSCSEGFDKLEPALAPLINEQQAGESHWRILPAAQALDAAAAAIRRDPMITHCGNPGCNRCNDAVAGGPIL